MAAQSQLEEIDAKLKDTKSIAPFDGFITHKHVNQGDTVQPGQPLLASPTWTSSRSRWMCPTRLAGSLQPGVQTQVRLDDPKQTVVEARVAQVFPMADATRHTVRVKFDLKPGAPAKAGMYADVMIPQPMAPSRESLPVIPGLGGGLPRRSAHGLCPDAQGQPRLQPPAPG